MFATGCIFQFLQFTKVLEIGVFECCTNLSRAEHLGRQISKDFFQTWWKFLYILLVILEQQISVFPSTVLR